MLLVTLIQHFHNKSINFVSFKPLMLKWLIDLQIGKLNSIRIWRPRPQYRNETSHGKKNGMAMVHPEPFQGNAEMLNLQQAAFTVLKYHFFFQNCRGKTWFTVKHVLVLLFFWLLCLSFGFWMSRCRSVSVSVSTGVSMALAFELSVELQQNQDMAKELTVALKPRVIFLWGLSCIWWTWKAFVWVCSV